MRSLVRLLQDDGQNGQADVSELTKTFMQHQVGLRSTKLQQNYEDDESDRDLAASSSGDLRPKPNNGCYVGGPFPSTTRPAA